MFEPGYPVLIRVRRTNECRLSSCPTGFFDGIGIDCLRLQGMASHVLVQALFVYVVILFPAASLMLHRACPEKRCRDRRRFRQVAVVVIMVCSVYWSSVGHHHSGEQYSAGVKANASVDF